MRYINISILNSLILFSCNQNTSLKPAPKLENSAQSNDFNPPDDSEASDQPTGILNTNAEIVSALTSSLRISTKISLAIKPNVSGSIALTDTNSDADYKHFNDVTENFRLDTEVAVYFDNINEILCALGQIGYTNAQVTKNILYWARIKYEKCKLKNYGNLVYDVIAMVNRETNRPLDVKFWFRSSEGVTIVHAVIAEGVNASNPYGIFTLQFVRFLNDVKIDPNTPTVKVYLEAKRDQISGPVGIYFWGKREGMGISFAQQFAVGTNAHGANNIRQETYSVNNDGSLLNFLHYQMAYNNRNMLIKDLRQNPPLASCQQAIYPSDVMLSECADLFSVVMPALPTSNGFREDFIEYSFPEQPTNKNLLFEEGKYVENIPANFTP